MRACGRYALTASLAIACRNAAPAVPSYEVSAVAEPNPRSAVSARVRVTAKDALRVWVEHGETPAYGTRTGASKVSDDGLVTVPVIGLLPNATSHLRVHAEWPNGITRTGRDLAVTTPRLPEGVPSSIAIGTNTGPHSGYVLAGLFHPVTEAYYAVLLDRAGNVRWYWVAPKPVKPAAHFARAHGNFVVVDGRSDTIYELDLFSESVGAWKHGRGREGLDGHDFVFLENGNAVLIGWEHRTFDSTKAFRGGAANARRVDHSIDEIDPRGDIVFHWSTFDHIGLDEIVPEPDWDPTSFETDHTNSVETLPDEALLISARATSTVMKISRKDGSVLWRLGGKKSDFAFAGDPANGFTRQCDARALPDGGICVFDSGAGREPEASRVVCYDLDLPQKTATMTWEYRHSPDVQSRGGGSARRLPNGNTLVGYYPGLITEVDASKRVVWEARTKPFLLYRAVWTETLYGNPGGS